MGMSILNIQKIASLQAKKIIRHCHYAGDRMPGFKHLFGLFDGIDVLGVCGFSQPASYTLCEGVCGKENKAIVLELSRLVIVGRLRKNLASMLVAGSLQQLPKPSVVVSYADQNEGHIGYVYQATNWIYTGKGNAEPWWYLPNGKLLSKTRRHIDTKAAAHGLGVSDLRKEPKEGKHRYVYFVGNKRQRRELGNRLKYERKPYPKGKTVKLGTDEYNETFALF